MRAHVGRGLVVLNFSNEKEKDSLWVLKYFRTVESKRSASEESSDCLLPNETSGTGQQLNCSAEPVSVVASVVH